MNPCEQPGVNDGGVQTASPHPLDLAASRFSLANARELALYARMAYDETPTVQNEATDTQVLIRDLGDCVVVSCRGTTNLRDAITDAQAWFVKTPYGKIHFGVWRAWNSVEEAVYQALIPFLGKPVLLDGHSLGGGLAEYGAFRLSLMKIKVHSVYGYGALRIGNAELQKQYNAQPIPGSPFATLGDATFTLIHDCDAVPRMPGYLSGYRRPGHDEFISELSPDIWEDPGVPLRIGSDVYSLVRAWLIKRNWIAFTQVLTDHHIDNYIKALGPTPPPVNAFEAALSLLKK